MIIKYQSVLPAKKLSPIYILNGSDPFLINDTAEQIKNSWLKLTQGEHRNIELQDNADWFLLMEEANTLSLFNNFLLLDARFEKKTIHKDILKLLNNYLNNINSDCLIILRLPNVPIKSLTSLSQHNAITLIQCSILKEKEQLYWIKEKLQSNGINCTADVPLIINQYTKGNILAASQIINVLNLVNNNDEAITPAFVKEYLIDQSEYSLYEFRDQFLLGNTKNAINMLRQMLRKKTEPILLLWIISEEIRKLINLNYLLKSKNIQNACNELKIWPSQIKLYQDALHRLTLDKLFVLLDNCHSLDVKIKSTQFKLLENEFEKIVLLLTEKDTIFA